VVDLRGQLLDANGSATGAAFTINATGTLDKGSQYRPEIAPLADGGFVVTYHAIVPGTYISQADAFGRRYDRNGEAPRRRPSRRRRPRDRYRRALAL
jgi:hypothetical protein